MNEHSRIAQTGTSLSPSFPFSALFFICFYSRLKTAPLFGRTRPILFLNRPAGAAGGARATQRTPNRPPTSDLPSLLAFSHFPLLDPSPLSFSDHQNIWCKSEKKKGCGLRGFFLSHLPRTTQDNRPQEGRRSGETCERASV